MSAESGDELKRRPVDDSTATAWEAIVEDADVLTGQQHFDRALARYEEALHNYTASQGPACGPAITIAAKIARILGQLGQWEKAESYLTPRCALREQTAGPYDPFLAHLYNETSHVYLNQRRFEEAEAMAKRAIEIWETTMADESEYVASGLSALATIYFAQEKYAESYCYSEQALEAELPLHPDGRLVANILSNMGNCCSKLKRHDEAAKHWRRAVDVWIKNFGEEQSFVLFGLVQIAQNMLELNRWAESREPIRQALAIVKRAPSGRDDHMAALLSNLAESFRGEGRTADALVTLEESLELHERYYGVDAAESIEVLRRMTEAQFKLGRHDDAERTALRWLSALNKSVPRDGLAYARGLAGLALVYREMGKYEQALRLLKQVTPLAERVYGSNHVHYAASLLHEAEVLRRFGRVEEAHALERRANLITEGSSTT